jgi:hypothetical protein
VFRAQSGENIFSHDEDRPTGTGSDRCAGFDAKPLFRLMLSARALSALAAGAAPVVAERRQVLH